MRRTVSLLTIPAAALAITACSKSVDTDELEKQVAAQFEAQGIKTDEVNCEDDLEAEVDATTECEVTGGGETVTVELTVTEVDGNNVKFDILPVD